jgi:hypothetical protein
MCGVRHVRGSFPPLRAGRVEQGRAETSYRRKNGVSETEFWFQAVSANLWGKGAGLDSLPAKPETVACYISQFADGDTSRPRLAVTWLRSPAPKARVGILRRHRCNTAPSPPSGRASSVRMEHRRDRKRRCWFQTDLRRICGPPTAGWRFRQWLWIVAHRLKSENANPPAACGVQTPPQSHLRKLPCGYPTNSSLMQNGLSAIYTFGIGTHKMTWRPIKVVVGASS